MSDQLISIHLDYTTNKKISVQIDDHITEKTVILDDCFFTLEECLNAIRNYYNK